MKSYKKEIERKYMDRYFFYEENEKCGWLEVDKATPLTLPPRVAYGGDKCLWYFSKELKKILLPYGKLSCYANKLTYRLLQRWAKQNKIIILGELEWGSHYIEVRFKVVE